MSTTDPARQLINVMHQLKVVQVRLQRIQKFFRIFAKNENAKNAFSSNLFGELTFFNFPKSNKLSESVEIHTQILVRERKHVEKGEKFVLKYYM